MKHESDDSGIIVYEIRDDYSVGTSTKSKIKTDTTENKSLSTSDRKEVDTESMAQLGGFSGRVYDKLTHRTIEGVLVTFAKDLSVKTDEKGMFSVVGIKPGKYRITVFEDGYVVQSCKGSAVTGEMTKLESFHLIPDCLAAEYPEGTDQTVEEEIEEEVVEFAMEHPQVTSSEEIARTPEMGHAKKEESEVKETLSEELSEKTAKVSSDVVAVRDSRGETVAGINKPGEETEEISFKEILSVLIGQIKVPSVEVGPPHAVIPAPEEKVAFPEKPSVTELPCNPVDATVVETVQLEGIQEKIQEEAPQEFTVEEIPIESPLEDRAQRENTGAAYQEQLFQPAAEYFSRQAGKLQEHQGESAEPEPFVETISETIPQEEPAAEASLEEMQTPVIGPDSIEAVISVPEELFIGEKPSTPVETTIAKTTQPEETLEMIEKGVLETDPQALHAETSPLKQLWEMWHRKENKGTDQIQPAGPSTGDIVEQAVPLTEYQEQPLKPSIEPAPQAIAHEDFIEETRHDEPPVDEVSLKEIQSPVINTALAETAMPVPEKDVIDELHFNENTPLSPVEITNAEAAQSVEAPWKISIEEASIEAPMEDPALEEIKEGAYQEQLPESFAEESIKQAVSLQALLVMPLEPFVEISPEIAHQGELSAGVPDEEPPVEISLKEIETPSITSDSTEAAPSVPEEIIIEEEPSVKEASIAPVEAGTGKTAQPKEVSRKLSAKKSQSKLLWWELRGKKSKEPYQEQSIQPSMEVTPEIVDQKEVLEKAHEKEQPVDNSAQEASGHGTVDEHSVTPEEAPEDIEEYDIASLSDEERAAISNQGTTVQAAGFEGSINAQPNPAYKGLLITIAYHLRNLACDDPNDLVIRITIENPDTGEIHETFEAPVTCIKDTFSIGGFTFSTTPYDAHVYHLNMQIVSKKTQSTHQLADTPLEIKNLF